MGKEDEMAKEVAGTCHESYVELEHSTAMVCLILNCLPFVFGWGTVLSSCLGKEFNCTALVFGLLQWALGFILIGYIWSVIHGIKLLDISKK